MLCSIWVIESSPLFEDKSEHINIKIFLNLPAVLILDVSFRLKHLKRKIQDRVSMKVLRSTEQLNGLTETVVPSQHSPIAESSTDEWLLATHGRTFHFASRFLAPKMRRDVITLYAFFRTLDDLVDIPVEGRSIEDIRIELDAWKSWFSKGRSFSAPRESLGSRLATVLNEHCVPTTIFLDFLEGMTFDLEPQQIYNFSELYRYCYRVAGTVGLAMAHILGANSTQALDAAENLGIAMQLTNILRDIGGDLALGRIYLPREDLERFGCSSDHLAQLYWNRRCDERFRCLDALSGYPRPSLLCSRYVRHLVTSS